MPALTCHSYAKMTFGIGALGDDDESGRVRGDPIEPTVTATDPPSIMTPFSSAALRSGAHLSGTMSRLHKKLISLSAGPLLRDSQATQCRRRVVGYQRMHRSTRIEHDSPTRRLAK